MYNKLLLALCALICFSTSLKAASLHAVAEKKFAIVQKLDYEGGEGNARRPRQSNIEDESGEGSDEDDEEDDAESQHLAAITQQQAYEQSVVDSQEGSDEDSEDNFQEDEDDDSDYFSRRIRRDAIEVVANNEIETNPRPAESSESTHKQPVVTVGSTTTPSPSNTDSANTSVLILIRDVIKKVTELPNTQQVATSAQQYFQLFEHFLQQTIEQVIGDDDEDDDGDVESLTIVPEEEKETVTEISNGTVNAHVNEITSDKENFVEPEMPLAVANIEAANEVKA